MKVKYFLEYVSAATGKGMRSDLGYNIKVVEAAVYARIKAGDTNIVILPQTEESSEKDDFDKNIIDV